MGPLGPWAPKMVPKIRYFTLYPGDHCEGQINELIDFGCVAAHRLAKLQVKCYPTSCVIKIFIPILLLTNYPTRRVYDDFLSSQQPPKFEIYPTAHGQLIHTFLQLASSRSLELTQALSKRH